MEEKELWNYLFKPDDGICLLFIAKSPFFVSAPYKEYQVHRSWPGACIPVQALSPRKPKIAAFLYIYIRSNVGLIGL